MQNLELSSKISHGIRTQATIKGFPFLFHAVSSFLYMCAEFQILILSVSALKGIMIR